ncbi:MAG TPA: hypothetical protein PK771_13090, partial [Spirochaetota bacterium]|nr:hypothetical protein [Spirochaetota bacterium]
MRRDGNTEFSLDSMVDIICNLLGMMILILVCITIISFTKSLFAGNTNIAMKNSEIIVERIEGRILPKMTLGNPDKFPYIIICKYNKL